MPSLTHAFALLLMLLAHGLACAATEPESQASARLAIQVSHVRISSSTLLGDGKRIAVLGVSALAGKSLLIHETANGQTLAMAVLPDLCSGATRVLAEADGLHVVVVGGDGSICRFDAEGRLKGVVAHPLDGVMSAAVSGDASRLALGTNDGRIAVLEWPSGKVVWSATVMPESYFLDLAFTPDTAHLIACCGDRRKEAGLMLVSAVTGAVERTTRYQGLAIAVAPDGKSVALLGQQLDVLSLPALQPLWNSPTVPEGPQGVEPMGVVTKPTELVFADQGWYFANRFNQLVHAGPGGKPPKLVSPNRGASLVGGSRTPAWIDGRSLHLAGRVVTLPASAPATRTVVAISPNKRWMLVAHGHDLHRFDLKYGGVATVKANTGFAPTRLGIDNQGEYVAFSGSAWRRSASEPLQVRPEKVLAISNDGDSIVGVFDKRPHLRSLSTGKTLALADWEGLVELSGSHLLYRAKGDRLRCASLADGNDRDLQPMAPAGGFPALFARARFSQDGETVAIDGVVVPGAKNATYLGLWSCRTGAGLLLVEGRGPEHSMVMGEFIFADNSRLLVRDLAQRHHPWYFFQLATRQFESFPAELGANLLAVANGRIVSLEVDNTLKFSDATTGKLLATVSLHEDASWVVAAPGGLFDTSSLVDNRSIRWIVPGRPLDPLPLEAFYKDYFEPNLLAKVWRNQPLRPLPTVLARNLDRPSVRIDAVTDTAPGQVDVTVTVHSPGKANAQNLRLMRDGVLVASLPRWIANARGEVQHTFRGIAVPARNHFTTNAPASLFSAWAFNDDGVRGEAASLRYAGTHPLEKQPPRVFTINVGVNWHENPAWALSFAVNDAKALGEAVSQAYRAPTRQVFQASLLSLSSGNANASKVRIRSALQFLAGGTADAGALDPAMASWPRPGVNDVVIFTFAGHGFTTAEGMFYLVPQDTGAGQGRAITGDLTARSISAAELYAWLEPLDVAKVAIIIDACNSSAAIDAEGFRPGPSEARTLGQLAYDKGMTVLAAAAGDQSALEFDSLQHGLLSWVLVKDGMESGKADREPANKRITIREWLSYAVARTPELARSLSKGEPLDGRGASLAKGVRQILDEPTLQQPKLFDYGSGDFDLKRLLAD